MEIVSKSVYNDSNTKELGVLPLLFRKDIEPHCSYCRYSAPAEPGMVICRKKGIIPESEGCRRFRYDPLRRTPPKPVRMDFSRYDARDYSL